EHDHPDVVLGAPGERAHQLRPVAVGLQVQRDGAYAGKPGDRVQVVGRIQQVLANAFTATLPLCEISAIGPGCLSVHESPHIGARAATATMPLPFGPQTGSPYANAASRSRSCASRPPGA